MKNRHHSTQGNSIAWNAGKMLCILLVTLAAFPFQPLQAQNDFNMPFSQFGMGLDNRPYNLPLVARTGGIAYTRAGNNYVNPFNPASYAAIDLESFVFDMGVGLQITTQRDNAGNTLRDADGNLAYLMVAMPVTKWWKLAAGLMPFSTVAYETVSTETDPTAGTIKTVCDGNGGINEIFLGSAFNILKGGDKKTTLQAGFNAYFLTGSIERSITKYFTTSDYYMPNRRYKQTTVNNFCYDLGLQLRQPLGTRAAVTLGLVYKPYLDLKVNDMALIYTCHASDPTLVVDTIFPARGASTEYRSSFEQAQTVGAGLALEFGKQWRVACDATFASWQGIKYTEGVNPPVFSDSSTYGPYSRYAFGLERTGSMDASTYWGRMSWSFGAHLAQGVLRLNVDGTEHSLDQWGFGAGVSMPMRRGRSLLTLSVDYSSLGRRDLLQSNVLTFGIAVSSCERWFFKRKYN